VGRADIMAARIQKLGLTLKLGDNCDGINILNDPRHREYGLEYCRLMCRKGVSRAQAVGAMHPADASRRHTGPTRRSGHDVVRNARQLHGPPEACP
jgi:hypothetical protein